MIRRAVVFFLLLSLAGCSSKDLTPKAKTGVVARFDGAEITEGEFLRKIQGMPRPLQKVALQHKAELIEDMAAEHFLLKEAERQGLRKDPDVQELIQVAQKKIVIAKLIDNEIDKKIEARPEDVSQYYEYHKEQFMTPLLIRARHILVKTEDEALGIQKELEGGAEFAQLARDKSIDSSAVRGGELGIIQKGQFVPELEEAIFRMQKGETSSPVKTQFGYHIIHLQDRMEPKQRNFESVKKIVEERLVHERRAKAFKEYVDKLRGNMKIEVNEDALNKLDATI